MVKKLMNKVLSNILLIMLFWTPRSLFGMDSKKRQSEAGQETHGKRLSLAAPVKFSSKGGAEFDIDLGAAKQSKALKNMIEDLGEDIGEEAKLPIPLPEISEQQFELLLPVMQKLYELSMAESKPSEEELAQQLQQIVTDLKSNDQPLDNQKLIELVAGINYLDLPILEPALKALAQRMLNKDEWTQLDSLGDKIKDLWRAHPAKELAKELVQMQEGLSLQHPWVDDIIESMDDKNLISWFFEDGTIKVWDKNNLAAEPITLKHRGIKGVIESLDGKNLISWSCLEDAIKIWDKNNLTAEPITLKHAYVKRVIESSDGKNLISWSYIEGINIGTIKVWDKANLAKPIYLQDPRVRGVIESRDGESLISWSFDAGDIKIWDKTNLAAKPTTLHHQYVSDVIESMDGKNLISVSGYTIKIWDKTKLNAEPITLQHPWLRGVMESLDGKNLISWSNLKGTIKVWDKTNLPAQPTTLQHPNVRGVIESRDGKNLISWSWKEGTIKIWDKNNLDAEPITLKHLGVDRVIESLYGEKLISWGEGIIKIWDNTNLATEPITLQHPNPKLVIENSDGNLISWSKEEGTIKIWNMTLLAPTSEQIHLLLAVYFLGEGNQKFELPTTKLSELKIAFNTLSPITQASLEKRAPHLIAAIKSAQK